MCETLRLLRVELPSVSAEILARVEAQIRQGYGGRRHFLRKGVYKKLTQEQKRDVFADGMTNKTNQEIMNTHEVSRRSLYRLMKQGLDNRS